MVGLPGRPEDLFGPAHLALSGEVALLLGGLGLLAAWRPRHGGGARVAMGVAAAVLLTVLVLRLADLVAEVTAGRPFDPSFDMLLLGPLWSVLSAAVYPVALGLGSLAVLLALGLGCRWFARAAARSLTIPGGRASFAAALAVALAVQGWSLATGGTWAPFQPLDRSAAALLTDHAARYAEAGRLRDRVLAALSDDPVAAADPGTLSTGLGDRDVIVVWMESYGLAALTDPRSAPLILGRLEAMGATLGQAGFQAASGVVESPVLGGRSWLAHGTFRSGVALPEPPTQDLLLASGRLALPHAFAKAGRSTVAVAPGLERDWPEGARWGFDRVVRREDLGYRGPAFGWSPMPDQFVLERVEAMDLRAAGRPVYLEVILTSSHAPWTPLPPWRAPVGAADGAEYHDLIGPADYTAMADLYARALDYSLSVTADWLVRAVDDGALVVLIGDHPALPWISGGTESRRVPWHLLCRDRSVLDRLAGLGLVPGMLPDMAAEPLPMQDVLGRFLAAFGPAPAHGGHPGS